MAGVDRPVYCDAGRVEDRHTELRHRLTAHPVVRHAVVQPAVLSLHGADHNGGPHHDGVSGGQQSALLPPVDGGLGVAVCLTLQGERGALPRHRLARLGQGGHPGGCEDTQAAGLLYGVWVGLHLADVLPLVPHHHPPYGQVVPGQAEPRVLSDHIPPGTDNRVRLSAVSVLTTL